MTTRRTSMALLVALALLGGACAETVAAPSGDLPAPTIGLGSQTGESSGTAQARAAGSSRIDTVVMIGDSITVASTPALEQMFADLGFTNVLIQSQQSKRTAADVSGNPSGVSIARFLLARSSEPDDAAADTLAVDDRSNELWVVALGTNDINQYDGTVEIAGAVDEMLSAVPDDAPVVWVDTYFRDQSDGAQRLNDVIAARLGERDDATVARWSEVAGTDGYLQSDGVHPRDEGSVAFASVVRTAVVDLLDLP